MAKKEVYPHADKLMQYDKIIEGIPGIERKGANVPYTSLNGNMFSYLDKEGTLALRLPEKERADFLKNHKAKLCEAYGIVQKEYVSVPETLFADTKKMKVYFKISFEYASSLKAKATKKSK